MYALIAQQNIRNVMEDPDNFNYLYVTYEDLCKVFKPDEVLLSVRAPFGTVLDVPLPEKVFLLLQEYSTKPF